MSDDKRSQSRVTTDPDDYVMYNTLRVPLRNWSPVGLLFGPMGTPPEVGQKLELKVRVKYRQDRLRVDVTGEVIRVEKGMVAVRYECRKEEDVLHIKAYFAATKPGV